MKTAKKPHPLGQNEKYKGALRSMYSVLGNGLHSNAKIRTLTSRGPKNNWPFNKDVVKVFIRKGLLRKKKGNTYSWTVKGLEYVKSVLGV